MNWRHSRGSVETSAPSNIALVKYWGKKGLQLPLNPSLSLTLDHCRTNSAVNFEMGKVKGAKTELSFSFHGEKTPSFLPKIETFLARTASLYSFIDDLASLDVHSDNTFPHSSGIASSASAFAALAMAFEEIQSRLEGSKFDLARAGQAARLGSGSACRSLEGCFNFWGQLETTEGMDERALPVTAVHDVFKDMKNAILIVSSEKKSVGSSLGHSLMNGHPYGAARIEQAGNNALRALACLKEGDVEGLGEIIEGEAMALHALMMTSSPSFMLMKPNTLNIIEMVRSFRQSHNVPVYFTLDAGPNPHLLYLKKDREAVENILLQTLLGQCEKGKIILDHAGEGAKITESRFE